MCCTDAVCLLSTPLCFESVYIKPRTEILPPRFSNVSALSAMSAVDSADTADSHVRLSVRYIDSGQGGQPAQLQLSRAPSHVCDVRFHVFDAFDLPWPRAAPSIVERFLTGPQLLAGHLHFT